MSRSNTVAKIFSAKFAAVFSFFAFVFLWAGFLSVANSSAYASDSLSGQKFGINSVNARLSEEITMRYDVILPDGFGDPEMVFSTGSRTFTSSEYEVDDESNAVFSYPTTPQNVSETVKAELYAMNASGEKEKIDEKSYSLESYCKDLMAKDCFEGLTGKRSYAAKMLAASVLKYGKAAEALVYGTDVMFDGNFERYQVKYDNEQLPQSKEAVQTEIVQWKSAGVSFSSGVSVYFTARVKKSENTASCNYSITNDGKVVTDNDRTIVTEDGEYLNVKFYTDNISPVCFKNEFVAHVSVNDNIYGGECRYNVNSCIYNNMKNEKLSVFVDAVFCYGKAANLYEVIDAETTAFIGDGSVIDGTYSFRTSCNGYEYRISLPGLSDDCYDLTITDEINGRCKYVLARGEYYDAFGTVESEETDVPELLIGNSGYGIDDSDKLSDATDGRVKLETSSSGSLLITLNGFETTKKLSVYSKSECEIKLVGTNSICYGSGQKSVYSPVKLSITGNGSLKSGAIDVKEMDFSGSVLNVNTGEDTSGEYALKTGTLASTGSIEITTNYAYGLLASDASGKITIADGGITITNSTVGIKGIDLSTSADAIIRLDCASGMDLTGKLSVSSAAEVTINAENFGIKANEVSLSGTVNVTTQTGTAIEMNMADTKTFKNNCKVNLTNLGKAIIAVKVVSCEELIVRGAFSFDCFKYYFYTNNPMNDSVLSFESFSASEEIAVIKAEHTKGFLSE